MLGLAACGPSGEIRHLVLVSLDDVGARHVGAYGYSRDTTPNLDALARQGTLFESAYVQQTWTLTSHLSMMNGLDARAHGASRVRPASAAATPLAEILWNHGFATAAFTGGVPWLRPHYGLGRGFERYELGVSDARRDGAAAVAWLREQAAAVAEDPQQRFFLFVHYFDAHSDAGTPTPYHLESPGGFDARRYLPEGRTWDKRGGTELLVKLAREGASETDRAFVTAYYDAGVRYVDEFGLGPLVAALDELGLARDTLLVVTADHGEEIFEHGSVLHGYPYDETARVPLVLRGPGIAEGLRVAGLAAAVDLMPTLLSLLGLPAPAHVQGRDLTPLLRGGPPVNDAVYVDGGQQGGEVYPSSVVADLDGRRWSFVARVERQGPRYVAERPGELYDHAADPQQQENVAAAHPELAARLSERLVARLRAGDELGRSLGRSPERVKLSPDERRRLKALGYAE